jgi:hypothetical protein
MSVAVIVVLAVVAVLLMFGVIAVVALVLIRRIRTTTRQLGPQLHAELVASGETVLRGPDAGAYRGGSAPGFSKLKGNCLLAITDRRVVYRMFVGDGGEIPRDRIVGVREDKGFLGSRVGGRTHLILQLSDGEVGLFVQGHAEWLKALTETQAP